MLRQALDAAADKKKESTTVHSSEVTALAQSDELGEYGATSDVDIVDGQSSVDDDDGESSYDESQDEDDVVSSRSIFVKVWDCIKTAFLVVANVENLWDTPPDYVPSAGASRQSRRRNNLIVLFWFVVLATSYASERSTFKLLVDRAGPFRLFSVEMVTACHALMLLIGMLLAQCFGNTGQFKSLGVPLVDVGLMALIDTANILLVFLSGIHVPPTLTVILIQFTLPLTAFLARFVRADGGPSCFPRSESTLSGESGGSPAGSSGGEGRSSEYGGETGQIQDDDMASLQQPDGSRTHAWGAFIIFLAVVLALCPAFYSIVNPDFFIYADAIPVRTALNSLVYVSSCIPAAASQLYKEQILLQYKQPVNMHYLNLLLSIFQFIFASTMSPLVFSLQGLGAKGDWTELYPSAEYSENFLDGLKCFFGLLDETDQKEKYSWEAQCDLTIGLVFIYAFSIIAVGVAVDKIVNAGATKVMYRGVSAGIILAVLCMHAYDVRLPDFNYGPAIDGLNLVSVLLLILGSEVYHRVSLQDSTFETVYPEVQTYYDLE